MKKEVEVVAGIVKYIDEILCVQKGEHKHSYMSFKFEFPGGKIENNESYIDALKRELKEELDLNIEVSEDNYFMRVDHEYEDLKIHMYVYECFVKNKNLVLNEHYDYKWLKVESLNTLDWVDADKSIKDKLMKG